MRRLLIISIGTLFSFMLSGVCLLFIYPTLLQLTLNNPNQSKMLMTGITVFNLFSLSFPICIGLIIDKIINVSKLIKVHYMMCIVYVLSFLYLIIVAFGYLSLPPIAFLYLAMFFFILSGSSTCLFFYYFFYVIIHKRNQRYLIAAYMAAGIAIAGRFSVFPAGIFFAQRHLVVIMLLFCVPFLVFAFASGVLIKKEIRHFDRVDATLKPFHKSFSALINNRPLLIFLFSAFFLTIGFNKYTQMFPNILATWLGIQFYGKAPSSVAIHLFFPFYFVTGILFIAFLIRQFTRTELIDSSKKFTIWILFSAFIYFFLSRTIVGLTNGHAIILIFAIVTSLFLNPLKKDDKSVSNILMVLWSVIFVFEILIAALSKRALPEDLKVLLWFGMLLLAGNFLLFMCSKKKFPETDVFRLVMIVPLLFVPFLFICRKIGIPFHQVTLMVIMVCFVGVSVCGYSYVPLIIIFGIANRIENDSGKRCAGVILGAFVAISQLASFLSFLRPVFMHKMHINYKMNDSTDFSFVIMLMAIFGLISFLIFLKFPQSALESSPNIID